MVKYNKKLRYFGPGGVFYDKENDVIFELKEHLFSHNKGIYSYEDSKIKKKRVSINLINCICLEKHKVE